MNNQTFETTIPFQGFYCSIHDGCITGVIEMGMLILCHWQESDIDEVDSLDYGMSPMHEVVSNELPPMAATE